MSCKLSVESFYNDIKKVLGHLERDGISKFTEEARDLLMMVAMHESMGLRYDRQIGGGPARGYLQMEGRTHDDIYISYLRYRPSMFTSIVSLLDEESFVEKSGIMIPNSEALVNNHYYAIAMARIHFYRVPKAIPRGGSKNYLRELGNYCKLYYNGPGKATPEEYIEDYLRYWLNRQ